MPVLVRDPHALQALKKIVLPQGDVVSPDVAEESPDLALPIATTNADQASNDQLKRILGLDVPSPERVQQSKDLATQETAINNARTAQNPDVAAEAATQQAAKLALAGEPNRVAGVNALAAEQAKGQNALALERTKQGPLMNFLGNQPGASGASATGLQWKPTITENGVSLSAIPPPAQVLTQQHAAEVGLGGIHALRQIVTTLNQHGSIGPAAGRLGQALTSTGLDAYLLSPEASQAFNDFKAQASLVKSNMAMAHGGARGGSSPALIQRFDDLINPHQTAAALQGGLDAFERWLTAYAHANNSADLDAADVALGVSGGAPTTDADPYSNPDYQPH